MKTDVSESTQVALPGEDDTIGRADTARNASTFRWRHLLLLTLLFAVAAIAYAALVPAGDREQIPAPRREVRLVAARDQQAALPLQDRRLIAERLDHADKKQRNAALREAILKHNREVTALLALASKPKERYEWFDSRQLAVDLLAHYGTREAIPVCVRCIEYSSPPGFTDDFSFLAAYPCAMALRKIGLSAQPEVFTFLQSTPVDEVSDKAIELYAYLMLSIYNSNAGGHEEGIEVVRRAAERAPEDRRENLQRLLDKILEITANYEPKPPAPAAE